MAYQALYRKWRPCKFSDIVGQEYITDTLKNEVASEKFVHAYLFCGIRGTGKTTAAKILSRAINCESPKNGDPCNECASCRGLLDGSIMDVVEIDAASNNGVDNIRELRDEVLYPPANVKFRVYIIDEVHMLSTGAFNALLKTLEEPPQHAVFILATTETHKVPATIQSRCQRFDFRRISNGDIAQRINVVAVAENINMTPQAVLTVAALADGSMRDALSVLEQCVTIEGQITHDVVEDLVGIVGDQGIFDIAEAIISRDASASLTYVNEILSRGKDVLNLLDALIKHFRNVLVAASCPGILEKDSEKFKAQSDKTAIEHAVYIIRQLSETSVAARLSENPRVLLEAAIVKICYPVLCDSLDAVLARLEKLEKNGSSEPVDKAVDTPTPIMSPSENTSKNAGSVISQKITPVENTDAVSLLQTLRDAKAVYSNCLIGARTKMNGTKLVIIQANKIFYNKLLENSAEISQKLGMEIEISNAPDFDSLKEKLGDKLKIKD